MSLYLLDTDWIVDCLYGQTQATQTLLDLAPSGLAVSIITYGRPVKAADVLACGRQSAGVLRCPAARKCSSNSRAC